MHVTQHARDRWARRFPELNLEAEYARANQRIGRKIRRILRQSCPKHHAMLQPSFKGRYYRMTPEGVVFVVAHPEVVITVLDLTKEV